MGAKLRYRSNKVLFITEIEFEQMLLLLFVISEVVKMSMISLFRITTDILVKSLFVFRYLNTYILSPVQKYELKN